MRRVVDRAYDLPIKLRRFVGIEDERLEVVGAQRLEYQARLANPRVPLSIAHGSIPGCRP